MTFVEEHLENTNLFVLLKGLVCIEEPPDTLSEVPSSPFCPAMILSVVPANYVISELIIVYLFYLNHLGQPCSSVIYSNTTNERYRDLDP